MQSIRPCLWFDHQAEDAAQFYTTVFKNSRIISVARYGKEGFEVHGRPEGSVLTVEFELDGQKFIAMNGGPAFKFNEAVSFEIRCASQEEVDYYWDALTEGGDVDAQQCGWLKDKFGVSWQVVPQALIDLMGDPDREKAGRVMNALLQMKKLDVAGLQRAYEGR